MCLTRMPLAQSAQLPPQLDACGFELDVLAPQLGSGAYAAVRKLRHRKTGREVGTLTKQCGCPVEGKQKKHSQTFYL